MASLVTADPRVDARGALLGAAAGEVAPERAAAAFSIQPSAFSLALGGALAVAAGYGALVAAACWPRRGAATPVAALLGPDDRLVAVEGHALRVRVVAPTVPLPAGRGAPRPQPAEPGPRHPDLALSPLVLIHGFAGSAATWEALAPLLARHRAVYAVDLLGFGLSAKPTRADYSLAGHGRRVAALLAALGLRDVTLVGHSMGGVVAAYAALADAGGLVGRVALLDANFYRRNGPPLPLVFPLPLLLARSFYSPAARARSLRRCYADPARLTPAALERYLAPTRTPGAVEALAAFLATPGPATYAHLPARVARPALVVWGADDGLWPLEDAQRLHRELAGSALRVLPGAGHMVQEEQPEPLAELLEAFAAGRVAPKSAA